MSSGRHGRHGRHSRGAVERSGPRPLSFPADRLRPWLAALAGSLAAAAASLAAVVDDPRLLRLAVLLAIAAAVPFGVATMTATVAEGRRLAGEVAALRSTVEMLARRPGPVSAPPTVFALASSYAAVPAPVPASASMPAGHRWIDADRSDVKGDLRRDDVQQPQTGGVRLPLVQAALRATAGATTSSAGGGERRPGAGRPLVLDLVALEDEVDVPGRLAH
ncbi:MAG: hypothetical protein ACJ74O_07675 [Frankiaceae bacterium]